MSKTSPAARASAGLIGRVGPAMIKAASRRAPGSELASALVVAILIVGFVAWGALTLPIQAVTILGVAAVVAFIAWSRTTLRYPVQSRRVVAVYLLAVAFQLIHLSEEYVGGFPHEFVELFNSPRQWSEQAFLLLFVFGFGALWVTAAAGALYQVRITNYMIWFYALGAGLINAISHFVFPILKGGYFPGLYTAAGHLVLSVIVIYLLVKESRQARQQCREEAEAETTRPSAHLPRGASS